ncbi:MAG: class I SAM-dependent methyltransferase [Victivallaceae bacterium]|nr:class I SAM-dependent methyltransferase [Victivallaceae bacterium]
MKTDSYVLLDSGNLRKLEQVGPHRIVRPALNAFWSPALPESEWQAAESVFSRRNDGSGKWSARLPESWVVEYAGFRIKVKPTGFGHLGFFAEQYRNWEFFSSIKTTPETTMLNLFGYSGLGSMAMARSGAKVCHLDAAPGMIEWGRDILNLNPDIPSSIRWIADDVNKFVRREMRRGSRYDLIALDPPTFGRGSKGEVWKIETDLSPLLQSCKALHRPGAPFTLVLSCHSPGFSIAVLQRIVEEVFGAGDTVDAHEMSIPESTGRALPAGICLRWRGRITGR